MPRNVAEAFLYDTIDTNGHVGRQYAHRVLMHIGALDACAVGKLIDQATYGLQEPQVIKNGRMKAIGHLSHIVRDSVQAVGYPSNPIPERLRIFRRIFLHPPKIHREHREALIDVVVQVAGYSPPICFLCR